MSCLRSSRPTLKDKDPVCNVTLDVSLVETCTPLYGPVSVTVA